MGLLSGMRWSGVSVLGREFARTVFTIVLARLVGPEGFGIVAQAAVYVGIVGLFLDQGFSSALIQRKSLAAGVAGAVFSVNLVIGVAVMTITIGIAPAWAGFMHTSELTVVLAVLAPTLLLRSACVTPRALLLRRMEFRGIGIADIASAFAGGALGVLAAAMGAGYWALVVQIVATDVVLLLAFAALRTIPLPNLRLRLLGDIAGFSTRAFVAGFLGTVARNIDNVLVGKFQGPNALAFYGLGYRLLLLPIQLLSATIGNVLFPAFARHADDIPIVRNEMSRATRVLAVLALPAMALTAAAAPQIVPLMFGADWNPAVPIVQVLALAGGIQTIYQPTTVPLVLGLGHAKLILRLSLLNNVVFITGIVCGIPFSPLAVAIGYTAATVALVPVEWFVRRRLLGLGFADQARSLFPGAHVALWVAVSYAVIASVVGGDDLVKLVLGVSVAAALGFGVLRVAHRGRYDEMIYLARRMFGGRAVNVVVGNGAGSPT
jgi:PST family polysaccharide transporter